MQKLELINSDVCGPIFMKSPSRNRYFVTFIGDATRKVWLYPLHTKDQVLEVFKEFHATVERQTGLKESDMTTGASLWGSSGASSRLKKSDIRPLPPRPLNTIG